MQRNMNTRGSARLGILLGAFVLAAAIILVCWLVLLPRYVVASASMEKTLSPGDGVLVERVSMLIGGKPHRGQVVVYMRPLGHRDLYIHRVVAVPGDRLQLRNKSLFLNGAAVNEPYAQHITTFIDAYRDNFPQYPATGITSVPGIDEMMKHVVNGELVIPDGCYFVMGDNRDDALDSRYLGFIHREDVVGAPLVVYSSKDSKRIGKRVN